MKTHWLYMGGLILPMLLQTGCEREERQPVYPVVGHLQIDGKAAEHATVILHPVHDNTPAVVKPRGKVAKDGSFQLTTYEANDGAPAGEYYVTFELWLAIGRDGDAPVNRLPSKLAKPETSGHKVTIQSSPNTLEPFHLKR